MEFHAPSSSAQAELWPEDAAHRGTPASPALAACALLEGNAPTPITINGLRPKDLRAAKDGLIRFDSEVPLQDQALWALHVPRDPEFDEPDDGVIRKDGHDKKSFLHFRPDLEDLLRDHANVALTDWQHEWLAACGRVRTACVSYLLSLAQQMDGLRPGYDFEHRVREYADQHVLRVLKYVPRDGIIAKTHTDRCAITFHIAESAPGLYGHRGFDRRTYATPKTPDALCFTGQQLERITCGAVPSLYHGVENNTPGRVRWAIVFFGKMCPK